MTFSTYDGLLKNCYLPFTSAKGCLYTFLVNPVWSISSYLGELKGKEVQGGLDKNKAEYGFF